LGAGGIGVHAACGRSLSSSSLSYSTTVVQSLNYQPRPLHWSTVWNRFTPNSREYFQSVRFLSNSQSDLTIFSTAPAFLQPKSFWNILRLYFLSVALSFQSVPAHVGLLVNELADSLDKIGVTLPFSDVFSPLAPVIAKKRLPGDETFFTILSFAKFVRFPQRNYGFSLPTSPL